MSHPEQDEAAVFDALVAAKRAEESGIPDPPPDDEPPPDTDDEPAPEAGSSVSGASDAQSAPEPEIDLDALPPAVRARIERAQQLEAELQRERSDKLAAINRLQPTQRRLSDLERQLAAVSKPPAPQATPTPTAAPSVGSPKWDAWAKQFPEDADAILERDQARAKEVAELRAELARFRGEVAPALGRVTEFAEEQNQNREMAALTEAHPNWQELVLPRDENDAVQVQIPVRHPDGSVHDQVFVATREFGAWLDVQHPVKKQQILSRSAADNAMLLDDYKRDVYLAALHEAQPAATPEAEAAQRAHQRREQARASSVAPDLRGGNTAAARVDPNKLDDAALFDHLVRQKRKNQSR